MKKILLILALLTFVPGKASATELVVNGGFETGDLTGWTVTAGVVHVGENPWGVAPHSGDYMAALSLFGFLDAGLAQDVDLAGYTSAIVSFAYKLGALDITPVFDYGTDKLRVSLGNYILLDKVIDDPSPFWDPGWTTTSWTTSLSLVPAEWLGGTLSFVFYTENFGSGGGDEGQNMVAFIDDVSIRAFPERAVPDLSSTLLLLGMGLTGLVGAAQLRLRK